MQRTMRRLGQIVLAAGLVAAPAGVARAAEAEDAAFTRPAERRAGLVLGLTGGFGAASAFGYPNKAAQIGDPAFYAASGVTPSTGGNVLVMGALTDYLNFGFWLGGTNSKNDDWRSSGGGAGFRVEAFPLYALAPRLADLGVAATLGLGSARLTSMRGASPAAEGVQSFLGIGAFYEWRITGLFGGHLAGGPSLDYAGVVSRSLERHMIAVGGRIVLYTGR